MASFGVPSLRRVGRRLRHWMRPPGAGLIYHPDYAPPRLPGVPVDPHRAEQVLAWLFHEGYLRPRDVLRPVPAAVRNLRLVHGDAYLESLAEPGTLEGIFGMPVPADVAEQAITAQRLATGGTIHATRMAIRTGRPMLNLGGGFHHAEPDRGMGFCIYNDIAIAIARLRRKGWSRPVLVVDLDLHDGNGVRAAFATDPTVHTFSIHNATWGEHPAVAATVLPLGTGVDDRRFLDTLHRELPPVVAGQRPALAVYVAGTDPAADDRLGDWRLTADGLLARDRFVIEELRRQCPDVAIAVVLGGGYGRLTWRYTARFAAWLLTGHEVGLPDDADLVLQRFRRARAALSATGDPGDGADAGWTLTAEELFGIGDAPPPRRFLGRFSRQGLELLLERTGLLDQFRERGFPNPVLTIGTSPTGADVLRVHAGETGDLLVELTARRNATLVPGRDLLYVDWLLLQNPRVGFSPRRPPLPGQVHPGLGLLREFSALLMLLAEELRFEGVAFVPSHYWMAALGHSVLRFLDPRHEATFAALQTALAGLPLAEAARLLEAGAVRRLDGTPVRWEPPPMVIPVGESLRAQVEGPERAAAVAELQPVLQVVPAAVAPGSGAGLPSSPG